MLREHFLNKNSSSHFIIPNSTSVRRISLIPAVDKRNTQEQEAKVAQISDEISGSKVVFYKLKFEFHHESSGANVSAKSKIRAPKQNR